MVTLQSIRTYDTGSVRSAVGAILDAYPEVWRKLQTGSSQQKRVVIKPNWIQDSHQMKTDIWESIITHPEVLLAVVEVVAEKLQPGGVITVCDAPNTYASFSRILAHGDVVARLEATRRRFPGLSIDVIDLRREIWETRDDVIVTRRPNRPDPLGYVRLDLGSRSLLYGYRGEGRYYGADYDDSVVNRHHHGETHEYLLAGTPLHCDLFINLPKLKTHKKTGITCSLKNLVGINGDKNWLPHYTHGVPSSGGDEFPERRAFWRSEHLLKRIGQTLASRHPRFGTFVYRRARQMGLRMLGNSDCIVRNGNWEGNDTCWRMVLDLNRVILYGNPDGTWRSPDAAKPYFTLVDGIVGGEGNGPICAEPVAAQILFGGTDAAAVDAVACRLMGFDPYSIPLVRGAFKGHPLPIASCQMDSVLVRDLGAHRDIHLTEVQAAIPDGFRPHFAWQSLVHHHEKASCSGPLPL